MYSAADDLRPQMIPRPEMIPKLDDLNYDKFILCSLDSSSEKLLEKIKARRQKYYFSTSSIYKLDLQQQLNATIIILRQRREKQVEKQV